MLISLVLGSIVGAVLGLTGAGGGILAVPALVVGMGWPMQQATPVALVAVAG
ncbi:sulfite exporter TauE/SafE family protein, partial [Burkholderia pseudomallei]